ncbi:FAD-binding oxidoreductase [Rhodococcus sp. D2-41]|uniref:FAD-binding oxidoreductase n=1 Tax=Speluncibacter jeojiensis TaxID=2710754 RepID=A0A9X4M3E9_9ACTN|nr:FAD-dependent oxidoreductase [Rhodococcus sp. D2-41]MDG3009759.1 FAD-binding oxidoreductase [Rhodococcus sp. D2-41]MDG3014508.1 FAD-binding oxidoreductase [Corynebacteriales bacterium D3-21]
MQDELRFDVAVVGAGPLGAATARHLADRGAAVLVVGPDEPAGFEDHQGVWAGYYDQGRLGHVLEVPLVTSLLAARSMRRFPELRERSGVEFTTPTHSLAVLPDASENPQVSLWFDRDRLLRNAEDLGVMVEAFDEDGLRREYPQLRFPTGHVAVVQRDAFIVNPRELVRAELTAATAAGAVLARDEITDLTEAGNDTVLTGKSGATWRAGKVVIATGAAANVTGLLPRPLQMQSYGATVVLVEVPDPDKVDMPAMMYLKSVAGQLGFGGIVMSPLRYPDGKWYVKVSGRSLLDNPLNTADEIAAWVRTGGRTEDIAETLELLAELMPGQEFGPAKVRPCMVCDTPTDLPYIDLVDDRTTVVIEGERGVMAADEIGRLAAELTMSGHWTDGIPGDVFAARWADVDIESELQTVS